jgi:hypothetical protein
MLIGSFKLSVGVRFAIFFALTLWFPGKGCPGNPEFNSEVNKVWPRIVPLKNQMQVLLNDSF